MKRLIALWLTAALLLGGLSAHGAEKQEKVNLFQNPGFEEMTTETGPYDNVDPATGKPASWDSFNGWTDDVKKNEGNRAQWTKENPHAGTYCAYIRLPGGISNAPYIAQTISDMTPGGIYEIGFFAKAKSASQVSSFLLGITFLKNGETVREQRMLRTLPTTAWAEYKLQFPFPEDADSMRVNFTLSGHGDIYLDDVFLYKISEKPVFTLETDAVFYYSDDPTPCIASLHTEDEKHAAASFVLKEGTKEVLKKENVSFQGTTAKWEFPLSALEKEKTAYTLEALVTENGKTTLLTKEIYRYPRPSRLRSDGVYLKDGKPFVPVIGHDVDAEHLEKCAEAGINVVTIGYWYADTMTSEGYSRMDYFLDLLDQYDLMGIICLYRYMLPSGNPANRANTTNLLLHLDDHKHRDHIFAYSMMDEPLQNDVWCDAELAYGYQRIRKFDDEIPVLTVDCSSDPSIVKRNINYCDIYMCDAYYTGNGALSTLPGELVKLSKEVSEEGKRAVYHLTQAFEWERAGATDIFPKGTEIRHMIYQALLNGAQGVGYFKISRAAYMRDEDGEFIKDSNGKKQMDHLFNTDRWQPLCDFGTGDLPFAAEHFVLGKGAKISDIDGEGYTGRSWEKDGKTYVLLLSESETENKTASVSLPFEAFRLSEYGKAPHALIENGKIEYTLSPRECMLFVCEEIGVMHFFRAEGTAVEAPKKGETIRAEMLVNPLSEITIPLLGAYNLNELVLLDVLSKTDGTFADEWTCTFEVPADGLSYKAFLWDGMKP